jgi:hypothetical protein
MKVVAESIAIAAVVTAKSEEIFFISNVVRVQIIYDIRGYVIVNITDKTDMLFL